MIESKDIPYSKVDYYGDFSIELPKDVKELPPVFNELTDEVTWNLSINNNKSLTSVTGFEKLTRVGGYLSIDKNQSITSVTGFNNLTWVVNYLSIDNNESLTRVTGFDNLTQVGGELYIQYNPKLVSMSIPGSMLRSVNYSKRYGIIYDGLKFNSPESFINSPEVIDDLVSKFNPVYHNTQVINQIIENLEEWGTEETKEKVYSHLVSFIIDDTNKHMFTQEILNKYHPGTIKNNNDIIREIFLCTR